MAWSSCGFQDTLPFGCLSCSLRARTTPLSPGLLVFAACALINQERTEERELGPAASELDCLSGLRGLCCAPSFTFTLESETEGTPHLWAPDVLGLFKQAYVCAPVWGVCVTPHHVLCDKVIAVAPGESSPSSLQRGLQSL